MRYRDPRGWAWAEALELLRGAEQLQRRFFQLGALDAPGWEPPVDLYETADGLTLSVSLPGVSANALEVFLESVAGSRRARVSRRVSAPSLPPGNSLAVSSGASRCPPDNTSSPIGAWKTAA
jgi:hypothetical protein